MTTIMLNAHTRTGSELLLAILRSKGYYTLGEIVTNSVPQEYITLNRQDSNYQAAYFNQFNRGLRYQLNDTNVPKAVKVMINHLHVIQPYIYQYCTDRILLWRKDMFASQISHQTALARGSWIRWGNNQPKEWPADQEPDTITLDTTDFKQRLEWRIRDWQDLLANLPHYDLVTEYQEVVALANNNPNEHWTRPSAPATVTNIDLLNEIYHQYAPAIDSINAQLQELTTSGPTLDTFLA
jgi:hypothetical protein